MRPPIDGLRIWTVAVLLAAPACTAVSDSTTPVAPSTATTATSEAATNTATSGATADLAVSQREQSEALADCAAAEGVSVDVDPSGDGVVWSTPPGQDSLYSEVLDRCAREVAERFGVVQGTPDRNQLERWYRAFLWTRDCMIEHGYSVDEPPSLDAYIDSGGSIWHPYNAAISNSEFSEASFKELEATCPQDLNWLLENLDF